MLLADAATTADGKLNLLGAGWGLLGATPTPTAIGIVVRLRPEEAGSYEFALELVDEADRPVRLEHASEGVSIQGTFEASRRRDMPASLDIGVPLAFSIGPLVGLQPETLYKWRFVVDRGVREELPFFTRAH